MKICQELFNGRQVFAVTVQTSGGKPNGAFSISCEYVVFVVPEDYIPIPTEEDMKEYSSAYHGMNLATFNQVQRPNQTYPIYVDSDGVIVGCGKSLQERIDLGLFVGNPGDFIFDYNEAPEGTVAIWPVTAKGDQCVWRLIPDRLMGDWQKGYIKTVKQRGTGSNNNYAIQYLSGGIIDKILSGELETYRISDNPRIPTLEIKNYKTAGSGINSIWTDNNFYTTKGSNEIRELFAGKVFSYPKPLSLIRYILKRTTDDRSIILDFFSGSSTTAHATMLLNAEDNLRRKFIMIQLPEIIEDNTDALNNGYTTICDVGKERIRRAGKKIKEDSPLTTENLDIGFRVLKLSDSNMNNVFYNVSEYDQINLEELANNIKPDRTDLDLLFGCLLEWGLPLSLPYKSETIDGCTVHTYSPGDPKLEIRDALIACFDEAVPTSVIEAIARRNPLRAVFREECFTSSPGKINVFETFKRLAQGTAVKVI